MQKLIPKRNSHTSPSYFKKKEEGVSPVVGVMLMLVITIIVAAIVAAFSTGLAASVAPVPSAGFDYTIHAGLTNYNYLVTQQPPVIVQVTSSTGQLSSNDLLITTSYTVPDTYNGVPLSNAGKVITHTIDGRLENYGMSLIGGSANPSWPIETTWSALDDPFIPRTHLYTTDIVPVSGNGATVGNGMNDYRYFGGKAPIASGTLWWFKDLNQFVGFNVNERTTYGFGDGSIVHITVIHAPSNTVLSDKDVRTVW